MVEVNIQSNKKSEVTIIDFLQGVLKEIMSLLDAECGSLFLFDPHKKELVLDSFYNSKDICLSGFRQKMGCGISGQVADFKKPVLVKDIDSDSRFKRNGFDHYRTKSFISIPLFGANGLIGLMNIADKSNAVSFSEKDLEFTVTLCKYACAVADSLWQTEALKKEKEILDGQKRLLEKYASVGKLAAGVVHEVNNPLDGIIRYTNILLHQINNDSIIREYLLEIKKGLNRIANTTKSLLEFSHQVNSSVPRKKIYVNIHELINDSLDVFSNKLRDTIQINKKFKESIPRLLDLGLCHVVMNLTKNAIDAMPEGGTLEIATDITDSMVSVSFKDTGMGISDELKKHIFEPFFTTKSIDKGTGLGLPISQEIVHKYQGRIEFESQKGQGSVFTVLIPKEHLENA